MKKMKSQYFNEEHALFRQTLKDFFSMEIGRYHGRMELLQKFRCGGPEYQVCLVSQAGDTTFLQ